MKKILKSFWNWLKSLTTLDEKAVDLYDEVKDRAKEVKDQSKDIAKAVKGNKKRGRKPNKTKTNNSKK
jgi:hypothetical protein